jgi:hypothetical protein
MGIPSTVFLAIAVVSAKRVKNGTTNLRRPDGCWLPHAEAVACLLLLKGSCLLLLGCCLLLLV